ncbi:OmpA family protein [Rapidithrix thailandica]|uniref:OmpA family protein n=1 Tax=Rapidithrix thailandica TaxID=413964 RepID=A0AAW9S6D4_9BACT
MKLRTLIFLLLLCSILPALTFAQKKEKNKTDKKEKGLLLQDFNPSDSSSVLRLPSLRFENINKVAYYYDAAKLAKIKRYRQDKQWDKLFISLYDYISHFGINNFLKHQDMELLWLLARVSEYVGHVTITKDVYTLIIKHYRGDLQKALLHYDSLTKFEKDLYVNIEHYYKLVQKRKAIDTLKPPENVLQNMGEAINSPLEDYGMTIGGNNDNIIYFTSQRLEKEGGIEGIEIGNEPKNENIYYSMRDTEGIWSPAKPFEGINTKYNEGSPCVSRDGKTLVFVRCHSPEGFGDCDLFISYKKEDGTWTPGENLGESINSYAWDSHPSFSLTEDTLYFASDRRGGFGGSDIYFSVKGKKGNWGKAQNIGPIINTQKSELSPYVHPKHNVLYFSSNGQLANFGSFDIFKSFQVDAYWIEPKNVGPLVNGPGNEFYFSTDSKSAWIYYAKSTLRNIEDLDLHSFPMPMEAKPNNTIRFSGKVVEPTTGEVFEGIVSVIDLSDGVEVAPKYLREDGTFEFELIDQKKYLLVIEGDNFFKIEEMFFVDGETEIWMSTSPPLM